MSDRRTTPANTRVAATHLPDLPEGIRRVTPVSLQIRQPVVDLQRTPGGARDRQLVWGDVVDEYETHEGQSFVQSKKDGYVGYVPTAALGPVHPATHWVSTLATHLYSEPDFKSPDRQCLGFGCRLTVFSNAGRFLETSDGFVPRTHLAPVGTHLPDPIEVAEYFLGTPYLWGGNSRDGIDCSGLVQAALIACGYPCPADSDQQEATLGELASDDMMRRGDLLFWKGHVALVAARDRLIHANAHHMAVRHEPLHTAIDRIRAQGDGPVTAHKRLY